MTREEAVKLLQATRLMLMDGANQPISDLYYALDMAIEALEQTEPTISKMEQVDEPQTCSFSDCDNFKNPDYARCIECKRKQIMLKDKPQTERSE